MFEHQSAIFAFNLGYIRRLAADIPDDAPSRVALPINPPHWILGHLCVGTDFITQIMCGAKSLPPAWHAAFGPGSSGAPTLSPLPRIGEFAETLAQGHERATASLRHADAARLATIHGLPIFPPPSPIRTFGDVATHLMTSHEAFHAGQLSVWRRALGLAPLL